MTALTPKAANHAGLSEKASRFVSVASLPWEKTRHPGIETNLGSRSHLKPDSSTLSANANKSESPRWR